MASLRRSAVCLIPRASNEGGSLKGYWSLHTDDSRLRGALPQADIRGSGKICHCAFMVIIIEPRIPPAFTTS
jgi:hypothetical protein